MDLKPNAHSRLFAILHEILTSAYACKTTMKKDEWPGDLAYNSNIIQVWFLDFKYTQSNVQYCAFNLSSLENDKRSIVVC